MGHQKQKKGALLWGFVFLIIMVVLSASFWGPRIATPLAPHRYTLSHNFSPARIDANHCTYVTLLVRQSIYSHNILYPSSEEPLHLVEKILLILRN